MGKWLVYLYNGCMRIKSQQIAALAYFDIFSFPLTRAELDLWAWQGDFVKLPVDSHNGFFYLSGRDQIVLSRRHHYKISYRKIKRALFFTKIFRLLPSVKMVAVCNSLGYFNARLDSDIDLFIIVKPGTIWLTRFWLQSLLKILKARPFDRGKRRDGVCLTFFLSANQLDIKHLSIVEPDVYLHYWSIQLIPIYDAGGYYEKFIQANDYWIKQHLPYYLPYYPHQRLKVLPSKWSWLFVILTVPWWEKFLRKVQMKILPDKLRQLAGRDSRVVLTDNILKFHSEDKRLIYYNLWQSKNYQN